MTVKSAIASRFTSRCPACETTIHIGDPIVTDPLDGASVTWVHEHCPPSRMDLTRDVCGDCFTEKSVDGSCMCGAL